MKNMDLRLGWRRGYAPLAGLSTVFSSIDLQMLSGFSTVDALYINKPTMGVSASNLGLNAMEFNSGSAIQRIVDRQGLTFSGTPSGFHTITIVYIPSLIDDTVIWALVPAKDMSLIRMTFKLSLQHRDRGDGLRWQFVLDRLAGDGSEGFFLSSSPSLTITAPSWYHIVTSLPYSSSSYYVDMYVNGVINSWGGRGVDLYAAGGAPSESATLFWSLADDDQYDGILGQTEGARKLVGRLAYFGYRFGTLSGSDTSSGEFEQQMVNRLYGTTFNWSSPMGYIPTPRRTVTPRSVGLAAKSQLRLGFC